MKNHPKSIFNSLSVLLVIISISGITIAGTSSAPFHGSCGISLLNLQPRNDFADFVKNDGWGINIYGAYQLMNTPISIGLDFVATQYGSEKSTQYPFGHLIPIELETTSAFYSGGMFLRLQPGGFPIQPYMDGIIGFNNLTTESRVRDEDDDDEEDDIASSINMTDNTLTYGIGGGVMLEVFSFDLQEASGLKLGSLLLDFGARYMVGGEAEYLNVNKDGWFTEAGENRNDEYEFHPDKSKTDVFTIDLGIVFKF